MHAPNEPLIRMSGVTKVFFTDEVETHALAGITLDIARGEYVSIAGPSGCGKTTLLSILGLLDSPTSGEHVLNGVPVADLAPGRRAEIRNREIGFIFQAFNLIGDLTVAEDVELPITYRGMRRRAEEARGRGAREVGMEHRRSTTVEALRRPAASRGGRRARRADPRAGRTAPGNRTRQTAAKDGAAAELPPGLHHRDGDARPPLRRVRRPHHPLLTEGGDVPPRATCTGRDVGVDG